MACFRPCDIRGRFPEEVNEELFYDVGRGIATTYLAGRSILVGCDVRTSSEALKDALIRGLVECGATVLDVGKVPTPVAYFGKRKLGTYAAAIITASHNPPPENGLKLLLDRYPATPGQIQSLRPSPRPHSVVRTRGSARVTTIVDAYLDFLMKAWEEFRNGRAPVQQSRFVLDPGNGAWSILIREILLKLEIPCEIINGEPDGRFPNRSADCSAPGSLQGLSECVLKSRAVAGIAWDGDGDRVAFCDDQGHRVTNDRLVLLTLPEIVAGTSGSAILYDVKTSRKVGAAIRQCGGIPIEERSAHSSLESRMIKEDCLFGCETSGHFFYRALCGADDGMYSALRIIAFLLRKRQTLSDLLATVPRLFITPDVRIQGGDAEFADIRERILKHFPPHTVSFLDGVKVNLPSGWLLARKSVSEAKISIRLEGESAADLDELLRTFLQILPDYRNAIEAKLHPVPT